MTLVRPERKLHIVYFGMMGIFSRLPLEVLLASGHTIDAIVLPALDAPPISPASRLPLAGHRHRSPATEMPTRYHPRYHPRYHRAVPQLEPLASGNLRQIAEDQGIPILEARNLYSADIAAAIAAYRPDAICVACFPWRLSAAVLQIPRLGNLNVHPSLLPDNRGPDPLFWTFRRGDSVTGVTVHLMDKQFDSGPVLRQETVAVPDGITERTLEERLAARGAEQLAQALAELDSGTDERVAQDSARATYYSLPGAKDWIITPDRSARWAFNFACGLRARSQPILIQVEEQTFQVVNPVEFKDQGDYPWSWRFDGQMLEMSCTPGVFRARALRLMN